MAGVLRSSLIDILASIKSEIALRTYFKADRIHYTARQTLPKLFTAGECWIRPRRGFNIEWDRGSSRWACVIRRTVEVHWRTPLELDQGGVDDVWLTHKDAAYPGFIQLEEQMLDALWMFTPIDKDANALTIEPMKLIESDDPSKSPESNNDEGYGRLTWEVLYMAPLDTSRE